MRTPHNTLVIAAVALAVGLTACGKSDPKPAEEAPKTAPKSGDEAAKKTTGDKAKAEGGKEAEKKSEPTPAVKPVVAAPVAGTPTPAADPTKPTTPTPAVAVGNAGAPFVYVGTPSLSTLLTTIKAAAADAQVPGAIMEDPEKAALAGLQAAMELSDTSWVDTKKPIRLIVADPRKFTNNGAAFVMPVTDSAKMLASLPSSANKDAAANGGHAAMFELRGEKIYIDVVEGHVVVSPNGGLFAATKDAIVGGLLKWTPSKPLEIRIDVETVNRDYAEELKAARQMAKELYTQTMKAQGQGALAEYAASSVDKMFDFVAATKALTIRVDAKKDHLITSLAVEGNTGSGVEQFAATMDGKRSALLGAVAKGAWFALAGNIDTRKIPGLRQLQGMAMRSYVQMLDLDATAAAKIEKMVDEMWQLAEGDAAMSLATEGTFPVALRYVASVTEGAKAQAVYHKLTQLFVDLLIEKAKTAPMEIKLPLKAGQSLSELVGMIGPFVGKAGMKVEAASTVVGAAKVDVLRIEIDWAKFPMAKESPAEAKIAQALLGNKFQFAMAYAGKYMSMSFGPNGEKVAADLALGKFDGGDPALSALGAENPMAITLNFGQMVSAFAEVSPGLSKHKEKIAALVNTPPMSMTMTTEGKSAVATLNWPISTIMKFANLMR